MDSDMCPVCLGEFTQRLRVRHACTYCAKEACLTCLKRYVLTSMSEPHCMHCRRAYTPELLDGMFSKAFRKNELRRHRIQILMEAERSLFPQTLGIIEREDAQAAYMAAHDAHALLLARLSPRDTAPLDPAYIAEVNELRVRIGALLARMLELGANAGARARAARREFVRKCPTCPEGFLSTAWRCPLCKTRACSHCLAVKGTGIADGAPDPPHECKPEDVESARTIEAETKPCPHCGVRVQKSEGCFDGATPVLLWSGAIALARDIADGDTLVGDDGGPRTVMRLIRGVSEMFEVQQSRAASYVVNEFHTLVLRTAEGGLRELTVLEFLALPESVRSQLRGFKSVPNPEVDTASELSLVSRGSGAFYGWEVDGNHRFLLADATVVRNCSQMWCTACNNAFDWRTGAKVSGPVHNPHFHEYQARSAHALAAAGVGGAGGGAHAWQDACENNADPAYWPWLYGGHLVNLFLRRMEGGVMPQGWSNRLVDINRLMIERAVSARAYVPYTPASHEDLRKKRLRRQIDDADWARQLSARETRREKENRQRLLDELLLAVGRDTLGAALSPRENLLRAADLDAMVLAPMEAARSYYNQQLATMGKDGDVRLRAIDGRWVLLVVP